MKIFFLILILLSFICIISFSGCEDNNNVSPKYETSMNVVSTYPTAGTCVNSYIQNFSGNDYSFLALGTAGLLILNVSDPSNIQPVSSYSLTGISEETFSANIKSVPYVFIASGSAGISVLDISNITVPVLDTIIDFQGDNMNSVFVDTTHNLLFAGGDYSRVYIMNISALPRLTSISTYQSSTKINKIQVEGNIAYVAQDGGMDVVDVSNPISPVRLTLGTSNDHAYDVKIHNNYAFVSNNENGEVIFNVSNPSNPQLVCYIKTQGIALACAINGNLVFVAEDQSGIEVFDVSDPYSPKYLSYYKTRSYSENLLYYKSYLFASDYNGYVILKYP